MTRVQRYLFIEVLRALVTIVGGLTLLAVLAQGLQRTDLIVENQQSAMTYFYVVLLGAPQIIALLTPLALFIAGVWALNRIHRDSEIVVAQAAGMTRWQIASPILRLAVLAAIAHLCVNLWVQPSAQQAMRDTVSDARGDLAASLIRPGQFTRAGDNLTFYARARIGGDLKGILISDGRDADKSTDYLADTGTVIRVEGKPSIVMIDALAQEVDDQGSLTTLKFDQYTFDLSPFMAEESAVTKKASDKYLFELFTIDPMSYEERKNADKFFAEGHARLTTPLLSIAMAMLAIIAVLGGDFSRRGYGRRIMITTGMALGLVILQVSAQSAGEDDSAMNAVQWIIPLGAIAIMSWIYFGKGRNLRPASGPRLGLRSRMAQRLGADTGEAA